MPIKPYAMLLQGGDLNVVNCLVHEYRISPNTPHAEKSAKSTKQRMQALTRSKA